MTLCRCVPTVAKLCVASLLAGCLALEIYGTIVSTSYTVLFQNPTGPVDYNGTSVAAGPITADASLCCSVLQGGLIYEVHTRSPVATLYSHRK